MWNNSNLKAIGRAGYQKNYWKCVLVALLVTIVAGGSGILNFTWNFGDLDFNVKLGGQQYHYAMNMLAPMLAALSSFALLGGIFNIGLSLFVGNPVEIGCRRFFLMNLKEFASLKELGCAFSGDYIRNVKTMFFRDLYIFLWSLLFVIPGIVKSYEYRMVPYILAEHPELETDDVLKISRRMMNGNKWHAFGLDLSFFFWYVLSAITAGIVGVFVVAPYKAMTDAALFHTLAYPGEPIADENSWNRQPQDPYEN